MAVGSNYGPAYGQTHNGMVWDPKVGGYVAPTAPGANAATNATNAATTAGANAAAGIAGPMATAGLTAAQNAAATSAPGYMSAADKAASQVALDSLAATKEHNAATLAEQTNEFGATNKLANDKFAANKALHDQMIGMFSGPNSIFGSTPGGAGGGGGGPLPDGTVTSGGQNPAPGMPLSSADPESAARDAETAALTDAKERGGERLASSLKGLHELSAERGISGSGIEAKNTRDLYGGYLGDMAGTDRSIVEGRAARTQANATAQWQRQNEVQDRNFAAQQAQNAQRIQALLASFGMTY